MIRTDKLRGIIAARGLSQRRVARLIGITERTFYGKMQAGVFRSDEIDKMIEILKIENPAHIFLAEKLRDTQLLDESDIEGGPSYGQFD